MQFVPLLTLALAAAPFSSANAGLDASLAGRDVKMEVVTVTVTVNGQNGRPSPIVAAVPTAVATSSPSPPAPAAPSVVDKQESKASQTPTVGGDAPVPPYQGGNQINIMNNYGSTVYINWNSTNHAVPSVFSLAPGKSNAVKVEPSWAGAGFAGLQMGHTANVKFEFTFQGMPNINFFDVDVEKGASVPIVCEGADAKTWSGCFVDKLASCPAGQVAKSPSGQKVACVNNQSPAHVNYFGDSCTDWFVTSFENQFGKAQTKSTPSNQMNCWIGARSKSASKKGRRDEVVTAAVEERSVEEASGPISVRRRHVHAHMHAHRQAGKMFAS